MLRSSATTTEREIDIRAVSEADIDPLVPGGTALTALGRGATGTDVSTDLVDTLAAEIGAEQAVDAAGVAAAFEYLNRIVDGSGLPVGKGSRRQLADVIETLRLDKFPHASVGL